MRFLALCLVALWASSGVLAQTPPPPSPTGASVATVYWLAPSPVAATAGGKIQPSSTPQPFPGGVIYNTQEVDASGKNVVGSQSCIYSIFTGDTKCTAAQPGTTFSTAPIFGPIPTFSPDTHTFNGLFLMYTFSSGAVGTTSTVVSHYINQPGGNTPVQISASGQGQTIVALAPNTDEHNQFFLRWTDAPENGIEPVTVALKTISVTSGLTTMGFNTVKWPKAMLPPVPGDATNVIYYEGFVFFVIQNSSIAMLYKYNVTGPTKAPPVWATPNPCGMGGPNPLNIRLQQFDWVQETGEILSSLLIYGNQISNNKPSLCRISHHTGAENWPTPTEFPDITNIAFMDGGYGNIIISGPGNAGTGKGASSFIYGVGGYTGQQIWVDERHLNEQASTPSIMMGVVWYQARGGVIGRTVAEGSIVSELPFTCVLKPVVTQSRLFCVTSSNTLVSYAIKTDQMMWSFPDVSTVYDPQLIFDDHFGGTDMVAVVRQDGSVVAVGGPRPPNPWRNDTTEAPQAGSPPESHGAAIALGVILSLIAVAALTGGLVWYFSSVRKRRVAISDDDGHMSGEVPRTPGATGLYGTVNE